MEAWAYDSYCNDNCQNYIDEYGKKDLDKNIWDFLEDNPSEYDFEFVVGLCIWGIREKIELSKELLRTVRSIIDWLQENGKFKYWKNAELRKQKLKIERNIINNVLAEKDIKFGKLKNRPKKLENLLKNLSIK